MSKGIVVNRQINTQTTVSQPVYDDSLGSLPFYYFLDIRFCILLIVLGIIAGIVQFLVAGGLLILPFIKKNYVCVKCKYIFSQSTKPIRCPLCGGMVLSQKDYKKHMQRVQLVNSKH